MAATTMTPAEICTVVQQRVHAEEVPQYPLVPHILPDLPQALKNLKIPEVEVCLLAHMREAIEIFRKFKACTTTTTTTIYLFYFPTRTKK